MWATMKYVSLTAMSTGTIESTTPEMPPSVNIVRKPSACSSSTKNCDAAMNGVAITTSSDVEKFAHTSSGIRQKVIPGARIVMIVTRKLSAVMIDDAPANCTARLKKTEPSPWCVEQSGA